MLDKIYLFNDVIVFVNVIVVWFLGYVWVGFKWFNIIFLRDNYIDYIIFLLNTDVL